MVTQTEETVFQRIQRLCANDLGIEADQVQLSSNFVDDLNADSLDLVELIMSFEEEFFIPNGGKLEISDGDAEKIFTVQDVIDYLASVGIKD